MSVLASNTDIETATGDYLDFADPRPEHVHLADIATALGNTCRFAGHVGRYYSVAEHAVLVYELAREAGASPAVCFAALHHDDHEAYVGDIPTPLKRLLGWRYREITSAVDAVVAEALGIDPLLLHDGAVREADRLAMRIEARALKASGGRGPHWDEYWEGPPPSRHLRVGCWPPATACLRYLRTNREARAAL